MAGVRRLFDIAAAIAIVAGITMLVRPSSRGPQLVSGLGDAFNAAVTGAVGATIVNDQPDSTPPPSAPPAASSQTVMV